MSSDAAARASSGRQSKTKKGPKKEIMSDKDVKALQQKLKEEREAKRALLDERHEYILVTVAGGLGLDKSEVEDAILEGNQIEEMMRFFSENGSSQLLFYYQEPESEKDIVEHLRVGPPGNRTVKAGKPKVFITNGREVPLNGICLIFTRPNTKKAITEQSVVQEVNFTMLDSSVKCDGHGLLHAFESLFSTVFIPSLRKLEKGWGALDNSAGSQTRTDFLNTLDSFVSTLVGAQESLDEKVFLKPCETYDLHTLQGPQDYNAVASSTEALQAMEDCVAVWVKQIEQVVAESDQMRREADDIGPRAELDYWKKRMSKFNYLLDQIKSQNVKNALHCLNAAKSKTVKVWVELDRRITDSANEARDNVKFLYTLEKFCDPLYNSDPVGMLEAIPGLINAIRMINSISRYYNTPGRMTSLFVKITNQMITACKSYITCERTETIWTQPTDEVIVKLRNCIRLYEEYKSSFHKTKKRLEEIDEERNFSDFSEMYIFGKFDTFRKRLLKIIEIFETMEMYSHLTQSKIEGMELMANKFQVIVTAKKKKVPTATLR